MTQHYKKNSKPTSFLALFGLNDSGLGEEDESSLLPQKGIPTTSFYEEKTRTKMLYSYLVLFTVL